MRDGEDRSIDEALRHVSIYTTCRKLWREIYRYIDTDEIYDMQSGS